MRLSRLGSGRNPGSISGPEAIAQHRVMGGQGGPVLEVAQEPPPLGFSRGLLSGVTHPKRDKPGDGIAWKSKRPAGLIRNQFQFIRNDEN